MDYFLCVIGMVMIIEGTPYFLMPEKVKEMIVFMLESSESTLRSIGFGLMMIGLLLVYIGRQSGNLLW